MTPQELINSGQLELYVAGTLSDKDALLISDAASLYPEVKAEIAAIEKAFIASLEQGNASPSQELKHKIFDEIKEDAAQNIKPLYTKMKRWRMFAAAASILFLLNCVTVAWLIESRNKYKSDFEATTFDKDQLFHQNQFYKESTLQYATDLKVLRAHDFKKITMLAVNKDRPAEMACVYFNPNTHEVWVDNCGLENPETGKQYQLWAMVNGKPVDAGMFDAAMHNKGLQRFKSFEKAEAFAVTLEKEGGSPVPTMSALQVMGAI